ncbi:MAG: hypothetical protein U0703_14195 [Anaerolineae bacterium]
MPTCSGQCAAAAGTGVVTSFLFRLSPISTVCRRSHLHPAEDAEQIMKRWRDFILTAPDDINGWLGFRMCRLLRCFRRSITSKRFASSSGVIRAI